jgi:hypothetical protein
MKNKTNSNQWYFYILARKQIEKREMRSSSEPNYCIAMYTRHTIKRWWRYASNTVMKDSVWRWNDTSHITQKTWVLSTYIFYFKKIFIFIKISNHHLIIQNKFEMIKKKLVKDNLKIIEKAIQMNKTACLSIF